MDPVLEGHNALKNGGMIDMEPDEPFEIGEFGDRRVSNMTALLVVGAGATLLALRMAGIRFSFGVNVGGTA